MKQFEIPEFYRSPIIARIKNKRKEEDKLKQNFAPTLLDFGSVRFLIARHFGFCYGVENAIEIIYKVIQENPSKRIFLLSEMIHNPDVNADLLEQGVQFIQDTAGKHIIDWDDINSEDIVVIPAFGTTVEIENILRAKNIEIHQYDTTCPFVEKVWKKSAKLGKTNHSIIIHGKPNHEETRATFSHSKEEAPAVIVENMDEAKILAKHIIQPDLARFKKEFEGRFSEGFDPEIHLQKIGVVNQTTILATETQAISDYLKSIVEQNEAGEFADTRDTLCYATLDNQKSIEGMLDQQADMAIVVGGYNSSNTSHLVELCEKHLPTFYISSEDKIESKDQILHYDFHNKEEVKSSFLTMDKPTIMISSGASCPDAVVDRVIQKILVYYEHSGVEKTLEDAGF